MDNLTTSANLISRPPRAVRSRLVRTMDPSSVGAEQRMGECPTGAELQCFGEVRDGEVVPAGEHVVHGSTSQDDRQHPTRVCGLDACHAIGQASSVGERL